MKILLRNQTNHKWESVESVEYNAEKELQALLAEDPSVIALNELRIDASPLVVGIREVGLPGSGYTDLLAFSAAGDIAIVECKLAANAEIKRKVIAQVLEYAAYLWNMPYENLNSLVKQRTNQELADLVEAAAGTQDWNAEEFRTTIQTNLSSGSFTLVIAVDEMNEELERTLRFLNTCGRPCFAFTALEMRRFQRGGIDILVPHLSGSISQPPIEGERKRWTEERFFEAISGLSKETKDVIRDLYHWSKKHADRVWFGNGKQTGSFTFHYLQNGKTISMFSVFTSAILLLNYAYIQQVLPEKVALFHEQLVLVPGFSSIPAEYSKFPSVRLEQVFNSKPDALKQFKVVVEEFCKETK